MMDPAIIDSMTYRFAAAIICITCLFYSTMMRKRYRVRSRLFTMLVVITLVDSLTDVVSYFVVQSNLSDTFKWVVSYLCEVVYYFTHLGMMPILLFYIIVICGVKYKYQNYKKYFLRVPIYLLEILLLTNPFTQLFFTVEGEFDYARGWGTYIAYAISVYYLGLTLALIIKYWYTINGTKKMALFYFLSLGIGATIIQMIRPEIKCELLGEAIGLSGIMIMIEKDDDRTDVSSKAYNRMAFVQDMKSLFNLDRSFKVVCVKMENLEMYRKFYGSEVIDNALRQMTSFFMDDGDETDAYRTAYNTFFVLNTEKVGWDIKDAAKRIVKRFEKGWYINGTEIKLDCSVIIASCPDQFKTLNDIFLLESENFSESSNKIYEGKDLDFLIRKIEVEKAIGRGLSDKSFSVCYCPVYEKENYSIKLAEVRLRLHDRELGDLAPEEFMEVAENSGFIEELQILTIESVCRFLSSGVDKSDMQIDYVLVPVMSASLIKKELIGKIKDYIDHFKIDPSLIALVIKESYVIYAKDVFDSINQAVGKLGIRLYVSDYQAGFLGINTISSLDFEGVILDMKSFFGTINAESGDIVLANRTHMIKQLENKIILSGIDSYMYYEKIKDVNVDYVEGNFFSGEVSKNELQNKFWHGEHLIIHPDNVERVAD
ncbi:MAG: EAL domain-containing protein [Butyrivibrio sp.]|nr:EAL domain-containing protein [Butyrivibrio sp.]